jgi:hypothetical protein
MTLIDANQRSVLLREIERNSSLLPFRAHSHDFAGTSSVLSANGAEGISDIEVKPRRVAASERGERASFKSAESAVQILFGNKSVKN